jgi:hypothetical protein
MLPSVTMIDFNDIKKSNYIHETVDLETRTGSVYLQSTNRNQLDISLNTINFLQNKHQRILYQLEGDDPLNKEETQIIEKIKKGQFDFLIADE